MKYLVLAAGMTLAACGAWASSHATTEETTEETADTASAQSSESAESSDAGETIALSEDIDREAAAKIFKRSCRGCHGKDGKGAASYPSISDKEPEYIAEKLVAYRSGTKFGPNSILMISAAKKLSDEDIGNIAVYVATEFD